MDQQSEFLGKEETPVIPPNSDERTLAILSHILSVCLETLKYAM